MPAIWSLNVLGDRPFFSGSTNIPLVLMYLMLIVWSWTISFTMWYLVSMGLAAPLDLLWTDHCKITIAVKSKWLRQNCQSLLKPGIFFSHIACLVTSCHKLILHCWRCSNSLSAAIPRYSSFCEGEDINLRGFLSVNTPRKNIIWITHHLEVMRFLICEHEVLSALQVAKDFLNSLPVIQSWIRLTSAKHPGYKC